MNRRSHIRYVLLAFVCGCVGNVGGGLPSSGGGTPGPGPNPQPSPNPGPPSGNLLSPTDLRCDGTDRGATPARLRRLTGRQYQHTIVTALYGRKSNPKQGLPIPNNLAPAFAYESPTDRFTTYAASYTMTGDELAQVFDSAAVAASHIIERLKIDGSCFARITDEASLRSCMPQVVRAKGELLFRRPVTDDEVARYVRVAIDNFTGDRDAAVALALESMLLSPHLLFRSELGTPTGQGRAKLDPYEIATALAYTLTDWPPDEPLWAAAVANELSTPEQIQAQIERLTGGALDIPQIQRFFVEYFRYDRQPVKDGSIIQPNGYMPDRAIEDTSATIRYVLANSGRKEFWRTLLTTNTFVVRPNTAKYYGPRAVEQIPEGLNGAFDMVAVLPPEERAGILSMPAFLSSQSAFDHNNPVQRGRFVRESLLCTPVPDLPIGVVPPLPELGPRARMRDRLAQHSELPGCAACHDLMDPIGLGFEGYDHVGMFRAPRVEHYVQIPREDGTIDASGVLVGAGSVDGPFVGVPGLAKKLADSDLVESCFVRHFFRYWLGREELKEDACALSAAVDAYQRTEGDLSALLGALLTSSSYLTRTSH